MVRILHFMVFRRVCFVVRGFEEMGRKVVYLPLTRMVKNCERTKDRGYSQ